MDVGRGGYRLAGELLGCGVAPGQHPRAGPRRIVVVAAEELGNPEIEELRLPGRGDEDVRRLEVAMDHQIAVGEIDRRDDLEHQSQAILEREAALGAPFGDGLAEDELEGEVGASVRRQTTIDQLRDAGVIEARQDPPLGEETRHDLVAVEPALEELQRDPALESAVGALGEEDLAHAAATERRENPPGADPLAVAIGRQPGLALLLGQPGGGGSERVAERGVGQAVGGEQAADACRERGVRERGEPHVALALVELDQKLEELPGGAQLVEHRRRRSRAGPGRRPQAELLEEESTGGAEAPLESALGGAGQLADLLERETGEESELDDLLELRIDPGEARDRLVEGEDLFGSRGPCRLEAGERHDGGAAAALVGAAGTRRVDHDLAHGARRDRQKMLAIARRPLVVARELEIRLVHQGRGRERRIAHMGREESMRHPAELLVEQGEQRIERLLAAAVGLAQEPRDGPPIPLLRPLP